MHYYQAQVGTAEITFFENCDRRATVKVGRWIRRFWVGFKARSPKGSMAHAINHDAPSVTIVRRPVNDIGVVECYDPALVESFTLNSDTFAEFARVYLT